MGQKFAASDAQGVIVGFYDSEIHAPGQIPAGSIPITDEQWGACLAAPGEWIVNAGSLEQVLPSASELLASAKPVHLQILSAACSTAIMGGYSSSALGPAHAYGSQDHDQRNLSDAMNASLAPNLPAGWTTPLWCSNDGAWSFMPHTASQIQQVHADWLAFRITQQQKLIVLTTSVNQAATPADVDTIVW